jgi:hypothetical protein
MQIWYAPRARGRSWSLARRLSNSSLAMANRPRLRNRDGVEFLWVFTGGVVRET